MRDRSRATISDLRQAIDCLPHATKVAMLDGIARHPIIVGAYTDDQGICPMLAAHREGGRTSFIGFAKAWDRFAFRGAKRGRACRARRASERELLVLRTHLEASLLEESAAGFDASELAAARAEHAELRGRTRREEQQRAARREQQRAARREEQQRASRRSRREHAPLRPGDPDRSRELRNRDGWAWMRVVRRLDEYERVLERLEAERQLTTPTGMLADRELVGS